MNYVKFTEELEKVVQKKLGTQYQVSVKQILKNNGLTKDAILIREKHSSISQNIYLESFYDYYCECESLDEISDEIITAYKDALNPKITDVDDCFQFQNYKAKIFFRIIHFESNETLLANIPHIPYLDLAVTFHCLVSDKSPEIQFFTITNLLLEKWDVPIEKLYQLALHNTPELFLAHLDTLEHVMEQLLYETHRYPTIFRNEDFETELSNIPKHTEFPILVVTNQYGVNGATVILYPNILERIAEKLQSDLYVLPSSIHEVLILPANPTMYSTLENMVSEVNAHEVAQDDFLSNQVYFYNYKKHILIEKEHNTMAKPFGILYQ